MYSKNDDTLSKSGARALAKIIEAYWCERGYPKIRAVVVQYESPLKHCVVRSNIGAKGFPPK